MAAGLKRLAGTPAYIDNDVTVGVHAEYVLGAAQSAKSLFGVWWGTGVGGGLVLNGKKWEGRGAAGELGHIVVKVGGAKCTCGRFGCLEAYAGRGAMELRARHLHKRGHKTDLFKIMEKRERTRLQSGIWARALDHDDPMAIELIDRAIEALGAGIASAVNLLDVSSVVIGGGLGTRLGEPYVARIREAMKPHLFVDDNPPRGGAGRARRPGRSDRRGAAGAAGAEAALAGPARCEPPGGGAERLKGSNEGWTRPGCWLCRGAVTRFGATVVDLPPHMGQNRPLRLIGAPGRCRAVLPRRERVGQRGPQPRAPAVQEHARVPGRDVEEAPDLLDLEALHVAQRDHQALTLG